MKASRGALTGTYIALLLISIAFMTPFIWMVRSSVMSLGQIFEIPPVWIPDPVKWDNFSRAMTTLPFATYFKNTLIIVVLGVLGTTLSSTISAFGFSRIQWPGRDLVFGILLSALFLPGAVTLIPLFLGWQRLGFYDTFVPLILPSYFGGGIFSVFLLRQFYMSIPRDFDEAAVVDGAGYFQIYWHIILPLSRSAVIVVALFSFLFFWNDFFNPLIYLKSSDNFTLALGLQQFQGVYTAQWDLLMAASTVVVLPCILVYLIGQKYFLEGITLTGLKG